MDGQIEATPPWGPGPRGVNRMLSGAQSPALIAVASSFELPWVDHPVNLRIVKVVGAATDTGAISCVQIAPAVASMRTGLAAVAGRCGVCGPGRRALLPTAQA